MTLVDPVLFFHALATVTLVGLIWTIQLVHYPLFLRLSPECFRSYEAEHMRRITWLVGPLMLIEAGTALLLIVYDPSSIWAWVGGGILALIWISTVSIQGPLHARMAREGFSASRIRFLVRSNWIRTVAWTLRGILALLLLGASNGQAA